MVLASEQSRDRVRGSRRGRRRRRVRRHAREAPRDRPASGPRRSRRASTRSTRVADGARARPGAGSRARSTAPPSCLPPTAVSTPSSSSTAGRARSASGSCPSTTCTTTDDTRTARATMPGICTPPTTASSFTSDAPLAPAPADGLPRQPARGPLPHQGVRRLRAATTRATGTPCTPSGGSCASTRSPGPRGEARLTQLVLIGVGHRRPRPATRNWRHARTTPHTPTSTACGASFATYRSEPGGSEEAAELEAD